jgi:very-short-patch-repair endonuclease
MSPFRPLFHDYNKELIERAKSNRHEMTPAEKRMWFDILKNLPYRFLRQRVIGNYIPDFYCASCNLIIEVDGDSHFNDEAARYDKERSAYFESLGISTIRFTNDEILENPDGVYEELKLVLETAKK